MKNGQMLIVDMHTLAWKAYYSKPLQSLKNREGKPTGMFFGVLEAIQKILQRFPAAVHIVCAYDMGHSFREKVYSAYKANRGERNSETQNTFDGQISLLREFLQRVGYSQFWQNRIEADDIIAKACEVWLRHHKKNSAVIVSTDSDFYQLLAHSKRLGFYNHRTGVYLDCKNIHLEIPVPVKKYVYYKALVGDTADNIPRCLTARKAKEFLEQPDFKKHLTQEMQRNLSIIRLPFESLRTLMSIETFRSPPTFLFEALEILRDLGILSMQPSDFLISSNRRRS